MVAVVAALVLAGFWNFQVIDGFGRDVIATPVIGDPTSLSTTFPERGFAFGFLFAAVAGLAATFTACNCVVFAMLPGLACSGPDDSRRPALKALGVFIIGVVGIGAMYGLYVGSLGPDRIEAYNLFDTRMTQANVVFTAIGLVMMAWGIFDLGLNARVSPGVRALLARPTTKAAIMGVLVGAFAIGRPFPVMRDFLVYAATADSPLYGAAVMMVQGIGQIALMAVLFLVVIFGFRTPLTRWVNTKPEQVALTQAIAPLAGGTFFVFYWGVAFAVDVGRWGFKLGWY